MASIRKVRLKDGKFKFRAEVRIAGFKPRSANFKTMAEARQWSGKLESEMLSGRHRLSSAADHRTCREMIDRYRLLVLPKKSESQRFINSQNQQLLWWRDRLGDTTLSNVTQSLLAECRDELALDRKSSTVRRYLAAIGHVFTVAVAEWEWLDVTPMARLTKPKEGKPRVRFLSDIEREALLAQCAKEWRKPLFLIVVLAISTGARKMELLSIKWRDVDFERGMITLQHTKNHEKRPLFLTGLAADLLRMWRQRCHPRSDYVFASRCGSMPMDIDREFRRAANAADLEDFHFHDLRHTTASYLAMNGSTTAEIAEVLGHKTLNMVKRYAHLSKTHTAEVVASMNLKIFGNPSAKAGTL